MAYTVTFERDRESGWWVASVSSVRGCRTQGRTIDEARRRIREALGLFVDHADSADLVDDVRLPAEVKRLITAYSRARARADRQQEIAGRAARRAVKRLTQGSMRLSRRDAAGFLGISPQRVQQLLED